MQQPTPPFDSMEASRYLNHAWSEVIEKLGSQAKQSSSKEPSVQVHKGNTQPAWGATKPLISSTQNFLVELQKAIKSSSAS